MLMPMTSRAGNHGEPRPSDESATVAFLDAALSRVSHRDFVTRDEAVQLLRDAQASVADVVLGAKVASMVNDAVMSYEQDRLLDTHRVADALLDMRLVVTRGPSGDEDSEFEAALVGG